MHPIAIKWHIMEKLEILGRRGHIKQSSKIVFSLYCLDENGIPTTDDKYLQ
jgi:hypothetical protein